MWAISIPPRLRHKIQYQKMSQLYLKGVYFDTESNGLWYLDNSGSYQEISIGSSYKVYTALISQSGTNAPVATILQNTLGGTLVWSYVDTGTYFATLANTFLSGKTWMMITTGGSLNTDFGIIIYRNTDSQLELDTFDNFGSSANGVLLNNSIEIRVYP